MWGKTSPILAIGSYRGNLMIYNHKTARRVPIIGKHTKAITCGAWSEGGLLALGSEDRSMSISNMDGDTLRVATLRDMPLDIQGSAVGYSHTNYYKYCLGNSQWESNQLLSKFAICYFHLCFLVFL